MDSFMGKWVEIESDNIDGYMEALGLDDKQLDTTQPRTITYNVGRDDKIVELEYCTYTSKLRGISFTLGAEFELHWWPPGKGTAKGAVTIQDNKMIQNLTVITVNGKALQGQIIREIQGDEMVCTLQAGEQVAILKLKKVQEA